MPFPPKSDAAPAPFAPKKSFMDQGLGLPPEEGEEHEESQLLEEAAAALEGDPAHDDLVSRIRDCLAKHESGEYGAEKKPAAAVVVAPMG